MGLWSCTCPKGGVYEGEAHYVKRGKSLAIHFPKGVKTVKGVEGSCEEETPHNPAGRRKYLPHGLTECEKAHVGVRRRLARCIKKLEPRERRGEIESAVAVCRASIKCPP